MRLGEFKRILEGYKRVVLIGVPGSGKSTLAGLQDTHTVISTDKILKVDDNATKVAFNDQAVCLVEYIKLWEQSNEGKPYIAEGVGGYRMLRKGLSMDWEPDVVLWLHQHTYSETRHVSMIKGLSTVYKSYEAMNPKAPIIILDPLDKNDLPMVE